MNKRKLLTLALTLCMIAILAIGGTLAYFTDTEQANNTMVFGNIEINVDELAYKDGKFVEFKDDEFVLYPIDDAKGSQLYNKMVYTANTSASKDDAYIRTIVLIEKNDNIADGTIGSHYGFSSAARKNPTDTSKGEVGSINTGLDSKVTVESATIANNEYHVVVFEAVDKMAIEYNQCLASLNSVWIDENVVNAQIAGWGDKLDIIVFSQGIQATGLTHEQAMEELGEVNQANLTAWITTEDADNNDWFNK